MSNIMSDQHPLLKPSFCFNHTALRDFLRASRAATDDTISQNLAALSTPGAARFDPSSTAHPSRYSRSQLARAAPAPPGAQPDAGTRADACADFTARVLFPAWQARSDVLAFCAAVAASPDPADPEQALRAGEDAQARKRAAVGERLDPYSARYFPREARTDALAALLRNEGRVEEIIRARTWEVVRERCEAEAEAGADAEAAMDAWRARKAGG